MKYVLNKPISKGHKVKDQKPNYADGKRKIWKTYV